MLGFASHGPVLLLKPLPSGITYHITSFRPYPSPTSKGLQVAIGQLFRPLCLKLYYGNVMQTFTPGSEQGLADSVTCWFLLGLTTDGILCTKSTHGTRTHVVRIK